MLQKRFEKTTRLLVKKKSRGLTSARCRGSPLSLKIALFRIRCLHIEILNNGWRLLFSFLPHRQLAQLLRINFEARQERADPSFLYPRDASHKDGISSSSKLRIEHPLPFRVPRPSTLKAAVGVQLGHLGLTCCQPSGAARSGSLEEEAGAHGLQDGSVLSVVCWAAGGRPIPAPGPASLSTWRPRPASAPATAPAAG